MTVGGARVGGRVPIASADRVLLLIITCLM